MAVALDANATAAADAAGVTTLDLTTLTIGSGSNRVLVAYLCWAINTISGVTVVWDPTGANQALSLIVGADASDGARAQLWGLASPVSGNKTLRVSWTTATELILGASSFTGAAAFINTTTAAANNAIPNVTITSDTGDITVDLAVSAHSNPVGTGNQTQLLGQAGIGAVNGASQYAFGTPSNFHMWNFGASPNPWVDVGCDITFDPKITQQPAQQTVQEGQNAVFTITATSSVGAVTYQWQKNGVDIGGATSSTLTIGPVTYANNGEGYRCNVTGVNAVATSIQVDLVVLQTGQPFYYKA